METNRVNPIKNTAYLRPQKEWRWEVALYLYLAGMGAGSFAIGLLMDWLGYSPYPSRAILLWGPVLVAIGAPFLILDLGIKRRFLNVILNPKSSWLSRGFLILSIFIIIGLVILGISILPLRGIGGQFAHLPILDGIGFILALATAIYTGILIQSVKYVSFWNTPLLPLLFLVSALSTGAMGIVLSTLGYSALTSYEGYPSQMIHTLITTEQILILIEGLILGLYLFSRYRAAGQGESSVRLLLSGHLKFVFWIGIVVSGLFLPVILESVYSRLPEHTFLLFLTGVFSQVGGFFLRFGIVSAGIKDQTPLHKLIEIQYDWRTLKRKRV